MSNVSKRRHSRRRLAALTFLSNISLDGTHRDTNLGIFNPNVQGKQIKDEISVDEFKGKNNTRKEVLSLCSRGLPPVEGCKVSKEIDVDSPSFDSEEILPLLPHQCDPVYLTKDKEKVYSFVSETRARLSTLSQRRKQLQHQHSLQESHVLLPCGSVENLAYGPRNRKPSTSLSESACPAVLELRLCKNSHDYPLIHHERVVLLSSKKIPFVVFSSLPYHRRSIHGTTRSDLKQEGLRRRHASSNRQLSVISDGPDPVDLLTLMGLEKPQEGKDVSYSKLLAPSLQYRRCRTSLQDTEHLPLHHHHITVGISLDNSSRPHTHSSTTTTTTTTTTPGCDKVSFDWEDTQSPCHHPCHTSGPSYNPNLLDDPELIAGKHSTLLAFPSYIMSVIDYVKPSDLKKDLNDRFRESFPHIQLTLSKLRSLKKEMFKIARQECGIDLLTVAQAYVYFEKLILKMLINKHNRKLCAGACLMLSAKLNDIKGLELKNLIEKIECTFRLNRRDLLISEFGVLVALEFSLHLPNWEIIPHYQRLVYES